MVQRMLRLGNSVLLQPERVDLPLLRETKLRPEPIRLPTYNSLVHFWPERTGPGVREPMLACVTLVHPDPENKLYNLTVDLEILLPSGTTLIKRRVPYDASSGSGADLEYWKWPQEPLT